MFKTMLFRLVPRLACFQPEASPFGVGDSSGPLRPDLLTDMLAEGSDGYRADISIFRILSIVVTFRVSFYIL